MSAEEVLASAGALLRRSGTRAVRSQHELWRDGDFYLTRDDGVSDFRVTTYLRSRHWRNFSQPTRQRYARSLAVWLTFLERRHLDWANATEDDVDDFKEWRITTQENPRRVQGSTFNVDLAAIADFHTWAERVFGFATPVVRESRVSSKAQAYMRARQTGPAPAARPHGVRDRNVKWLEPRAVSRWINLALLGLDLDGNETIRIRNGARDSAYAQTLYGSGLRRIEGASLLSVEMHEALQSKRQYTTQTLAAACAKNGIKRPWWMPRGARDQVANYIEIDRAEAVARARRSGRYSNATRVIKDVSAGRLVSIASGRTTDVVPLDALGPAERMTLFVEGPEGLEPAMLWLNENGMPRPVQAWSKTFEIGNSRVGNLGLEWFRCTPHMLRHSFAFRWYCLARVLWERRLEHLTEKEQRDFRIQFGETWTLVQMLLGHKNPETTRNIYLEPFKVLEVDLIMEVANGMPTSGLLERLIDGDPRILTVEAS